MRRKLIRYCLATILVGVAFAWWFWPRDFLTAELLSQINIGMTSHEVIQILGTPTSERYQTTLSHKFTKTNIDGTEVPQHNEVVEPKNAWYPKLMVVTPYFFPAGDWQSGKLYFWADSSRIFWIRVDERNIVLNKTLAMVTLEGGGLKDWLTQQWSTKAPAKPAPAVMVTRAVPAPVPSKTANVPQVSKMPQAMPSQNGKYEFIPGPNGPYVHSVSGLSCIGTIDKHGDFQPDLRDLERSLEAHNRGLPGAGGSWPRNLLQDLNLGDRLYEYRKGILIPMVVDKDHGLIPEADGTIIEFKDYEYSPNARRIYNLPGRFVVKQMQSEQPVSEYEYVEDITVVYGTHFGRVLHVGHLNSNGQFVADPQVTPLEDVGGSAGPTNWLMQTKPGELLYEFHAGRLVPGEIKPNDVPPPGPVGPGSPNTKGIETSYFYPDLNGKIIELSDYLKKYDPEKSRRIYNLPGKIVKKGEQR